ICAIGMPAILIPSPFVPNNHQYYNGKALVDKDAAIMIEEKDLSGKKLKELIDSIIDDDERLKTLSKNAAALGNPNVLDDIVKAIEQL
ncbi:MAG: undecaprenyldiphospho-muramoylpentapeptide beta-N-acetylglucosaminyltransferase, partial [Erysipelotrichaceae bacterium]|nr:undecaprenyldiphospho-muramoylpentapeptide beta-N-acetylglucosaminyltransferase [Erysipelotrichaceae bacterium]